MRRVKRLARNVWWHLRREPTTTLASVLTSAVALSLVGVAMLASAQINAMKGYWYDKVEVSVFLCTEASVAETCAGEPDPLTKQELEQTIASLPVVQTVYYETREDAWRLFTERFGDSELTANLSPEALPESFRVKLVDPEQGAVVAEALDGTRGVESVQDQRQLLERFFSILERVQTAAVSIAALALLAAAALIAAGVRVAIAHRRQELAIMRMVGASAGAIRRPFLLAALVQGAAGGVLATLVLVGVKRLLLDGQAPTDALLRTVTDSEVMTIGATITLLGIATAVSVSGLSLLRQLRR